MEHLRRILVCHEDPSDRLLLRRELRRRFAGVQIDEVDDLDALEDSLTQGAPDVVFTGFRMRRSDGLAVLSAVQQRSPETLVFLVTSGGGEEIAVEAYREAEDDTLVVPRQTVGLGDAVRRARRRQGSGKLSGADFPRHGDLFDGLQVGVFRATPEGRLVEANPALVEILGHRDRRALLAHDDGRLVARSDWRTLRDVVERGGTVRGFETRVQRADGSSLWVEVSARRLDEPRGREPLYEGVLVDVTDRKHLEEELRQAQKLEAIGRLAGGVAHEFNNLLTGISGYVQLALTQLDEDSSARADLAQVGEFSRRAAELTRQLLAFSRRQPIKMERLDPNALVQEMLSLAGRLIGEDVELRFDPTPGLGRVKGDAGQLQQVLMNLAVNARDAMPGGGRISLRTEQVELDNDEGHPADLPSGGYVVISMTDTGHGMDAATQEHIFEPFFSTRETGKGTGLGLAMVHGIVKQHGGAVTVESEAGRGACFRIYLPRQEAETRRLHDDTAASSTETILLVEDEDTVRSIVERILRAAGYDVIAAAHPAEAERLYQEHRDRVAMLLTDVVMPGQHGQELYRRLLGTNPALKVLYMSGYLGVDDDAEPAVFRPLINKPFAPAELARRVRETLDG